jgi:hypothetical protein
LVHPGVELAPVKVGRGGIQDREQSAFIERAFSFLPDAEISFIEKGNQLIDRVAGGDDA